MAVQDSVGAKRAMYLLMGIPDRFNEFCHMDQLTFVQLADWILNNVESQLAVSLANESSKTWLTLEQDLLQGDYRAIRERQMDWIEREDGIMSSAAVTILRETVKEDATEVIRNQRFASFANLSTREL